MGRSDQGTPVGLIAPGLMRLPNCLPKRLPPLFAPRRLTMLSDEMRASQWQPIETAPKDGTEILLGHSEAVFSGWWSKNTDEGEGWTSGQTNIYEDYVAYPATHWMPLPAPPLPDHP
jgi:hypothetical protein